MKTIKVISRVFCCAAAFAAAPCGHSAPAASSHAKGATPAREIIRPDSFTMLNIIPSMPGREDVAAAREVVVAEQLKRMLESDHAILEFEDLRLKFAAERDVRKKDALLVRMTAILRDEIDRTELSLWAASHDSRLGFQQESDYVYTPYSLREKLKCLRDALEKVLSVVAGMGY